MARVARINVAPVKGMGLLHPDHVKLHLTGIPANRRFFLIDHRGELLSGFDHGPLVSVMATYDAPEERLSLRFPDGSIVQGRALPDGEPVTTDFHGRPVKGHLVPGPWSEAVSGFVGEPVQLVRTDHDGAGSDVEHLTIVSTESVADLAAHGRYEGLLDARRFRMDLELEGCEPFEEDAWAGRHVSVGDATIRVLRPVPRCRVTAQSPETGVRDWNTLSQIARYRPRIDGDGGLPFGMYARVERPGTVHIGVSVSPA